MDRANRRAILIYLVCFFVLGSLGNLVSSHLLFLDLVFCALALAWTLSIQRRIVHQELRHYLTAIGLLMLGWLVLRYAKYDLAWQEAQSRLLWYLYYVPMTLIPLLSFFAALRLGKPTSARISRWWWLLYLPWSLLVAGIVTNDLHQLAFAFAPGMENWGRDYSYGPLYALAVVWIAAFLLAAFLLIIRRSTLPDNRRLLWQPLLAPALSLVYFGGYSWLMNWPKQPLQMVEMFCFMIVGIWESLIQLGLVPSNTGYGRFFRCCHLSAQILDENGSVIYAASSRQAHPIAHRHRISGGEVRWAEDISQILRLKKELGEMNQRLAEEADLLTAENRLKEERAQITEQTRIYQEISARVSTQTARITALVQEAETNPDKLKKNMALACFLTAYVKRRANLTLHAPTLSARELEMSLKESLDYLRRCGVPCLCSGTAELSPAEILTAYDVFQSVTETALPALRGLTVRLWENGLRLVLETPLEPSVPEAPGFAVEYFREDEIVYLTLRREVCV